MLMFLKRIKEYIWPILEGEPSSYNKFLNIEDLKSKKSVISQEDIDISYKMYENQQDRINKIESKSIVFIGFFGSIVALVAFALKDLLLKASKTQIDYILLIYILILVIYITKVMWFSIKASGRSAYHSFSENDFLNDDKQQTVFNIINMVQKNYDTINIKVDYMDMAQKFTKRVIVLVGGPTFILLIYCIIKLIMEFDLTKILPFLKSYHIYFLIGFLFLCIAILFIKIQGLKRKVYEQTK